MFSKENKISRFKKFAIRFVDAWNLIERRQRRSDFLKLSQDVLLLKYSFSFSYRITSYNKYIYIRELQKYSANWIMEI